MSVLAGPSLLDLADLSPGLDRILRPYAGSAMLAASAQEVQRLRRHVLEYCRVDPVDLALFDHFPTDERQAIVRELHLLVHTNMQARQQEHARRMAAQAPVEELRRLLLTDDDRRQLVDLGIWAHMRLGDAALTEYLVDCYFDLTTVERVRAFVGQRDEIIAAFRAAVEAAAVERQARRQRARPRTTTVPGLGTAYAVLGLDRDASREAVSQAYRALAKRCHPDLGGDEAQMKTVNQAYSTIAATWR